MLMLKAASSHWNGCFIIDGAKSPEMLMVRRCIPNSNVYSLTLSLILQVIDKAIEVEADSSQFPSNWIFHYREKKPGKAFVDGLPPLSSEILLL